MELIKKRGKEIKSLIAGQRGTVIVYVGILILVLIGFAALAVDIGHLYVARNELQNAADAGALAGAHELYLNNGTAVNPGANQVGYDTARANNSQNLAVEVNWTPGTNIGTDVERGHWSFTYRQFTPSNNLNAIRIGDYTTEELDKNRANDGTFIDLVNAVRVKTRREASPVSLTFARIFGFATYPVTAEAVAYIGFAGTLKPFEVKQPVAICEESILDVNGKLTCGVGRFINSGQNVGHQTGGWTNFTQPCQTASTPTVRPLVCGEGNPGPLTLGQGIGTTGGEIETAFDQLRTCWHNALYDTNGDNSPDTLIDTNGDGWPEHLWRLTLPVIACPGNNTSNCATLKGAVTLDVIWITRNDKNQENEVPKLMEGWSCNQNSYSPPLTNHECWYGRSGVFVGFAEFFNLRDVLNNSSAIYEDKTIYFKPDCSPHIPSGGTGGHNFGILADIPVLVAPPRN